MKEVQNYYRLKQFLDNMAIPYPPKLTAKGLPYSVEKTLFQYFCREEVEDFAKCLQRPRLIELDKIFNSYGSCELSYNTLREKITLDEYTEFYTEINRLTEARNSLTRTSRDLQVIWITGQSGSGKTLLAKKIAQQLYGENDTFIAACGDHMFDSYDLQKCFILDEFRGTSMKFTDLLQLTDNHTNRPMDARYHNVDFFNCKLLIITSIKTPQECYDMATRGQEPLYQLFRRLGFSYVWINEGVAYQIQVKDKIENFDPNVQTMTPFMDVGKLVKEEKDKVKSRNSIFSELRDIPKF